MKMKCRTGLGMKHKLPTQVVAIITICLGLVDCLEVSLTVNVPAGAIECLHQHLEKGVPYEVEYQVIDGGDLDIDFLVSTPSMYQQPFITDFRRTGRVHKNVASETGDYKFCIDNSFSHFSYKLVFFDLYVNDGKGDDEDDDMNRLFGMPSADDEKYEIKLEDFKDSLDRIKDRLHKSTQTQRLFAAIEARDRSIVEHNFERVNIMSAIQVTIMVISGIVNIIVIRRLFNSPKTSTRLRT